MYNYLKIISFTTVFILVAYNAPGQLTYEGKNNPVSISLPASPTAEAYTRYDQYSVSYNTGSPNISIPLERIQAGRYNLEVALTNHASGIRVTEDASWVGLGWSLQGSGAISRVVRGRPDGEPTFGYFDFSENYEFPLDENSVEGFGILNDLAAGKYDGEPDLYSYNFPGHSGKFYIRRAEGNYFIELLQESNLQVSVEMNSLGAFTEPSNFTFTTPDGTIYHFSQKETTITNVWNVSGGDEFVSAFFLTSIASSDGKFINYSYDNETITQSLQIQTTDYINSSCGESKAAVNHNSFNTRYTKRLSAISGPFKRLSFNPGGTERGDLSGSYALDNITVERATQEIYTIDFQSSEVNGRLYLDGVTKDAANGEDETYTFEYYTQNFPSNTSLSQDFWGFYNGASNTTLLPEYPGMSGSFGDREPNEAYMLYGSLRKVNYPTGGYTEYILEANKHVREVTGSYQPRSKSFTTTNLGLDQSAESTSFTVNFEQDIDLNIQLDYTPVNGEPAVVDAQLIKNSTVIHAKAVRDDESWVFANVPEGTYKLKVWNTGGIDVDDLNLTANYEEYVSGSTTVGKVVGGLRVKEIINNDGVKNEYIFFKYEDSKMLADLDKYDFFFNIEEMSGSCFGGTVSFCSYVGRTSSIRKNISSQIISYGKVTEFRTTTEDLSGPVPQNPFVTNLPDYEIGRTEFQYNHPSSIGGGGFPYLPVQDLSYSKGQLKSKVVYNQAGQKVKEVINQYENITESLTDLRIAKAGFTLDWWCRTGENAFGFDEISAHYITPIKGWNRITSTVENEYDPSDPTNIVTTTTNYTYFDHAVAKVYQPVKIEIIHPNEKISKYRYYTRSYSSGLSHLASYPELLIEEVTTKDSTPEDSADEVVIAASAIDYSSNGPWPTNYYMLELASPISSTDYSFTNSVGFSVSSRGSYSRESALILQETYSYEDADNPSKPTQIERKGGLITSYGWNTDGKLATKVEYGSNWFFDDFETLADAGANANPNPIQGFNYGVLNGQSWSQSVATGEYFLEFWQKGNYSISQSGLTIDEESILFEKGNWDYIRARVTVTSSPLGTIEITGGSGDLIDCVRLYPASSQMINFLYDYRGNLTETIDLNGRISFYEYDDLGRLTDVYDTEGNHVIQNEYNH